MKEKIEAVPDLESFALSQEPAVECSDEVSAGDLCGFCGKPVGTKFTPAELAEYKLSGMCPACYRNIFG